MSAPPIRVTGAVLLAASDARTITEALDLFARMLALQGSRLTPRLDTLRRELAGASVSDTGDHARTPVPQSNCLPLSAHDLIGSAEVAELLQCTANNARDLARRQVLPAHRAGGRWLFEKDAVRLRAGAL